MLTQSINESKDHNYFFKKIKKYLPKHIQDRANDVLSNIEIWLELYRYPEKKGWFGFYGTKASAFLFYGNKKPALEFPIKAYLDDPDEKFLEENGIDQDLISTLETMYYRIGREQLEEDLAQEFGIDEIFYAGHSGGYLLIKDWQDWIYQNTGMRTYDWEEGYYEELLDYLEEDLTPLFQEMSENGPLSESWEENLEQLENYVFNYKNYFSVNIENVKKNDLKKVQANYDKLSKFIKDRVNKFEKGFPAFVEDNFEFYI